MAGCAPEQARQLLPGFPGSVRSSRMSTGSLGGSPCRLHARSACAGGLHVGDSRSCAHRLPVKSKVHVWVSTAGLASVTGIQAHNRPSSVRVQVISPLCRRIAHSPAGSIIPTLILHLKAGTTEVSYATGGTGPLSTDRLASLAMATRPDLGCCQGKPAEHHCLRYAPYPWKQSRHAQVPRSPPLGSHRRRSNGLSESHAVIQDLTEGAIMMPSRGTASELIPL